MRVESSRAHAKFPLVSPRAARPQWHRGMKGRAFVKPVSSHVQPGVLPASSFMRQSLGASLLLLSCEAPAQAQQIPWMPDPTPYLYEMDSDALIGAGHLMGQILLCSLPVLTVLALGYAVFQGLNRRHEPVTQSASSPQPRPVKEPKAFESRSLLPGEAQRYQKEVMGIHTSPGVRLEAHLHLMQIALSNEADRETVKAIYDELSQGCGRKERDKFIVFYACQCINQAPVDADDRKKKAVMAEFEREIRRVMKRHA